MIKIMEADVKPFVKKTRGGFKGGLIVYMNARFMYTLTTRIERFTKRDALIDTDELIYDLQAENGLIQKAA